MTDTITTHLGTVPDGAAGHERPTSTKFGFWLHAVAPVPELVELARTAERLGASAILLADEGIDRDIYVVLAAIAAATDHITLVPAITNPHSRHPVATAAALGSLEELAPGRIVAGLGVGGSLVFDPMGIRPARPYTALAETVEVVDELLAGRTVDHHGEFDAVGARLTWAPGRIPIGIAGRGPRVERLGAERADLVIFAGKAIEEVPALTDRVRARGAATGGAPAIFWNPEPGWTPEAIEQIRPHFAYMTVDMPVEERRALGVDDDLVVRLREAVHHEGPAAAARFVPDAVVERFAVVGDRDRVIERLSSVTEDVRPEVLVFGVQDYSDEFLVDAASIATAAGLEPADGLLLDPVEVRR